MTPRRWLRLEVRRAAGSTPESTPEWVYALTERLVDLGSGGVEESASSAVTFFAEPADPVAFKARVEAAVAELSEGLACVWSWQPHEEWAEVWRQGFRPHDFGRRLRVAPPWITHADDPAREVVFIDPGVAFGTAEHGSTRGCLALLEPLVSPGDHILDVGAGSGVLAIASIRLGAASAACVEIDPVACEALVENAERNGVRDAVTVYSGAFDVSTLKGPFEIVLCNMVWGRLEPLLQPLASRVASQGHLILGGCTADDVEAVTAHLDALGPRWTQDRRVDDEGWVAWSLRAG